MKTRVTGMLMGIYMGRRLKKKRWATEAQNSDYSNKGKNSKVRSIIIRVTER